LIGKTRVQKALFDIAIEHKVSKEHILMKINRLVNWKPFENELSKLYHSPIGVFIFSTKVICREDIWHPQGGLWYG